MAAGTDESDIGVLAHDVALWELFVAFSWISARGWGGGTGTIYTMLRELTHRQWITSTRFALDFGLARIIPGINLLSLAVMVGYRLNGVAGAVVCLIGLMLPASLLTVALTAGFAQFTAHPLGEAVVRGAIAVTAALTFALAFENGAGVVPWGERRAAMLLAVYGAAAFLVVVALHVSVAVIILMGAVFGAVFLRPSGINRKP
jgi:chromate transporter